MFFYLCFNGIMIQLKYINFVFRGEIMENNEVKGEKKTTKEKTIFGLKIAGNIIFYLIIIALLLFSIMNINAGSKNGGFPNIFGKGFLSVQSDSMTRPGTLPSEYDSYEIQGFTKGDLLYVSVINNKNINDLKKGDVVTFYDSTIEALNTHRIVYITYNEDNTVNSVSLQGDLSASLKSVYDPTDETKLDLNYQLQSSGDIATFSGDGLENLKGVVTGVNVGAGKVLDNIQKNWLWYFVLPVLVFLLFEVFLVVRNIMDLKGAKQSAKLLSDKEAMMADLEAQKEEMRKQILAELEQAQLEKSKKEDSDSSKDVNE